MTTMTITNPVATGEGRAAMTNPDPTTDIMQFPMAFPIKVMGKRADDFASTIAEVVRQHAPDFDPSTLEIRESKGGNYLSVTATINAQSRAQLDDLYRALTSHPMVSMAL